MEEISFEIAKKKLEKNWIFNLNNYWGKNTILLFYPNFFWKIEYQKFTITKFLIADSFIRETENNNKILIIERPRYFDEKFLNYDDNFNKKYGTTVKLVKFWIKVFWNFHISL